MKHLANLSILFILCLGSLFFVHPDSRYVLAFLSGLILISLAFAAVRPAALVTVCIAFLALAVPFSKFICFYPIAGYVLLYTLHGRGVKLSSTQAFLLPSCTYVLFLSISVFVHKLPFVILYIEICIFLAGSLMEFLAYRVSILEDSLKQTQDDSTERDLLMAEKNRSLLEKQDYEVYTATLKERNRIAREIHDNVGHLLSRSILLTGALKAVNCDPALYDSLDSLDSSLNLAMNSIRTSVHDLRDESIDLNSAIESLVKDFTFCPVHYSYDCGREVPREIKYSFIAVTKEALSNIMRHSNATKVSITLREHPAMYQLCVEDNGTGISPGFDSNKNTGMGIANMKERTDRLGGYIHILTEQGFKILITIPKETTL